MADVQQTLTGDAHDAGLYRALVTDGHINHPAWLRAHAEHRFVGTCRQCGDYLIPDQPHEHPGGRIDYTAACRNESCRWEMSAPGGRVMRHSTKLSDQPRAKKGD